MPTTVKLTAQCSLEPLALAVIHGRDPSEALAQLTDVTVDGFYTTLPKVA